MNGLLSSVESDTTFDAISDGVKAIAYYADALMADDCGTKYLLLIDCHTMQLELNRVWRDATHMVYVSSLGSTRRREDCLSWEPCTQEPHLLRRLEDAFDCCLKPEDILKEAPCYSDTFGKTAQDLYLYYQKVIQVPLEQDLESMRQKIWRETMGDPCRPAAATEETLKILLMGEREIRCLVKRQTERFFGLYPDSQLDARTSHIPQICREEAISRGAALLAAGRVVLRTNSAWRVTVKAVNGTCCTGRYTCKPMENIGQTYFILYNEAGQDVAENRAVFCDLAGLTSVRIGSERVPVPADRLPGEGYWYLGFCIHNEAEMVMHLEPAAVLEETRPAMQVSLRL